MPALLSVAEATEIVLAAAADGGITPEPVRVQDALGRVLASDVLAGHDVPPFPNSAMDGFAVVAGPAGRRLPVVGESRAGHPAEVELAAGQAIRISTGAALPGGADAVVRLEDAREHPDGTVELASTADPGLNVRGAGEDLQRGQRVLRSGRELGPAELALAVAAGVGELPCAPRPPVAVVATGDELRGAGEPLAPGEIHDSNRVGLEAMVARAGGIVVHSGSAGDDRAGTEASLAAALAAARVLVISGGVSVGPHDHVKPALLALGVLEELWGVALRPGKPTWFGTRGDRLVFGLPGNPVSAAVTFRLFVRPALRVLLGAPPEEGRFEAALGTPIRREPREHAVRVSLERSGGRLTATPTGAQGSHLLTSMLDADGLALVPAGEGELAAGSVIEVLGL